MLNANIALKKRNHAEFTVPQKQEIIDFRKKNPKISQKDGKIKFQYFSKIKNKNFFRNSFLQLILDGFF
jgi:hypothetical protein